MAKFDQKSWNPEVYEKYSQQVPNEKLNAFMKSGVFTRNQNIAAKLPDQVGGNYVAEPIKGNLDGAVTNYDGVSDIQATSRDTFEQGKIVVGRAKAWTEKDFSTELTGGEEFLPYASYAGEVGDYFQGIDQDDILAILAGIFKMADTAGAKFVASHTTDVTSKGTGLMGASTINRAMVKASGDSKSIYKAMFMHSLVAADLEDLQLLEYVKYTDARGITQDLGLGTVNGRLVVVTDEVPTAEVGSGEDKYTAYTTYILGEGAIEYADLPVKVQNEMARDPKTNGGIDTLYVRQRKMYAPKWISFTKKSMATASPTATELANGTNWEIVNNGQAGSNRKYVNAKFIPIARVISKASE